MKKAKVLALLLGWLISTQLDIAVMVAWWLFGVFCGGFVAVAYFNWL